MQKQMVLRALDQESSVYLTQGRGVMGTLASHFHCAYVIGMVQKGMMELTFEETRVRLGTGSYYLMNPFSIHHIRFIEPADYQVINVKLNDVKRAAGDIQLNNMYGSDQTFYNSLLNVYQLFFSQNTTYDGKQRALKYLVDLFINEQILRL